MKIDTSTVSFHEEIINSTTFKDKICADWAVTKALLIAVQSSFKNIVVHWVFDIVINAGQAVYDKVCPTAAP